MRPHGLSLFGVGAASLVVGGGGALSRRVGGGGAVSRRVGGGGADSVLRDGARVADSLRIVGFDGADDDGLDELVLGFEY